MENKYIQETQYVALHQGDPAPWFVQATTDNPEFQFHAAAGRYVVMCFLGSGRTTLAQRAMTAVQHHRAQFDDQRMCFFGVTVDPADEESGFARDRPPGVRFFLDYDGSVSRQYGALPADDAKAPLDSIWKPFWLVLNSTLRVISVWPFSHEGTELSALFDHLTALPAPEHYAGFEAPAPILVLPHVFEPDLSRRLIAAHKEGAKAHTGIMQEHGAMTVGVQDRSFKIRQDHILQSPPLKQAVQSAIYRRIAPAVARYFQFRATRIERYIVASYASEDGGHFSPHRDNTTKGTAHRCFAVSINLNADFEGGEIIFPEFGRRCYKPPVGGAVVFSCGLLHGVSKVTSGRRYAFLPFLYDEAAALLREENLKFVSCLHRGS